MICLELREPIPMNTPKGFGYAKFFLIKGAESDNVWTVFLDNGEIWDVPNPDIRLLPNWTLDRQRELVDDKIKKQIRS